MPNGWMPVDRWLAIRQACACKVGGTHHCADHSAMANLMCASPFGNDAPVILTGGAFPNGKVAHGKPSTRLPDLTKLRFGATCDGDFWAIERNPVALTKPDDRTVLPPIPRLLPLADVVRFADVVGRVGNID